MDKETFERVKLIMEELKLKEEDRKVVIPARERAARLKNASKADICTAVAIELQMGKY